MKTLPLPLLRSLLPALHEIRLAFARVGEVCPRGSARRCEGFNPLSYTELSSCDLPEQQTYQLTHSAAPVCRGNDPHAGFKASKLILPRVRGLNVAVRGQRGQKAPDLPALRRLPVLPYIQQRHRRSRDRERIYNSCSSALPVSDPEWALLSLYLYISQLGQREHES